MLTYHLQENTLWSINSSTDVRVNLYQYSKQIKTHWGFGVDYSF